MTETETTEKIKINLNDNVTTVMEISGKVVGFEKGFEETDKEEEYVLILAKCSGINTNMNLIYRIPRISVTSVIKPVEKEG